MGKPGNPGHSAGYRQKAVERAIANGNVRQTCRELKLARTVLYRWIRAYRMAGGSRLELRPGRPRLGQPGTGRPSVLQDLDRLRRKIGEQQVMIDFLSEACRRVGAPLPGSSGAGGKRSMPRSRR